MPFAIDGSNSAWSRRRRGHSSFFFSRRPVCFRPSPLHCLHTAGQMKGVSMERNKKNNTTTTIITTTKASWSWLWSSWDTQQRRAQLPRINFGRPEKRPLMDAAVFLQQCLFFFLFCYTLFLHSHHHTSSTIIAFFLAYTCLFTLSFLRLILPFYIFFLAYYIINT